MPGLPSFRDFLQGLKDDLKGTIMYIAFGVIIVLLDAKEASYYKGQYFFNDIEPGEYLIKVCALYGNWMVINKKDYKQEIEMLMSPPIQ